jgi:hypothetical protein
VLHRPKSLSFVKFNLILGFDSLQTLKNRGVALFFVTPFEAVAAIKVNGPYLQQFPPLAPLPKKPLSDSATAVGPILKGASANIRSACYRALAQLYLTTFKADPEVTIRVLNSFIVNGFECTDTLPALNACLVTEHGLKDFGVVPKTL